MFQRDEQLSQEVMPLHTQISNEMSACRLKGQGQLPLRCEAVSRFGGSSWLALPMPWPQVVTGNPLGSTDQVSEPSMIPQVISDARVENPFPLHQKPTKVPKLWMCVVTKLKPIS